MTTQTFSHMKGGKLLGITLPLLTIGLIALVMMLLLHPYKSIGFMPGISLLLAVGTLAWISYKFYKPAFTDILFLEEGIISKTHFEREELRIEDIKGIWHLQRRFEEVTIKAYSPNEIVPKGSMIIIGDIEYFSDAEYFGLNTATVLHDTFDQGYTALYYRWELDDILNHYYHKIHSK